MLIFSIHVTLKGRSEVTNGIKDATAMSQAIREKRISSRELVENAIQTIEKLNPLYNAVVSKQYETALAEADNLDRHGDEDKPFLGVPLLLKDLGAK